MTFRATLIAMSFIAAVPVLGQVGHEPSKSPYQDLEFRQELSAYTGYYIAGRDAAGVAPRSGPLIGGRYEVRVGGPAYFTARVARVFSERRIANPTQPAATRFSDVTAWPLYLTDASLTLNLTGQKSIRQFIPILNLGFGLASDFRKADVGGYRFGTTFAFSLGGGVRWTPGGPFQLRADLGDHIYQISYPTSYYIRASDSTRVLPNTQSKSIWKHNATLTVGASYLFFR